MGQIIRVLVATDRTQATAAFSTFLRNEKLRLMFGQNGASLDLGKAIEEGQIIIANVSTQGARVSREDASLFATLLLSDLWTAASERGKGIEEGDMKPFYVYVDEFQNFITPTIAQSLAEARGFGLHLTLANQFPRQILHAGASGPAVYDSVMANARSKIVFSLEGEENLKPLAQSLFMGVFNPDEIKLKLTSRKVMDYVERVWTVISESANWSKGVGEFEGTTDTGSEGGAMRDGEEQEARISAISPFAKTRLRVAVIATCSSSRVIAVSNKNPVHWNGVCFCNLAGGPISCVRERRL